ncbi:hypothetical protein CRENBAI_003753 [Crenichthys baileyi]|uniref:Uncharacterized protein n=1 Tax=Crenichthys baileyi TaxID=28760 RepID=A0AAV9RNF2_9TELE
MAAGESSQSLAHFVDPEELIPKRGAMSVVWKFFGFKKSDMIQNYYSLQMLSSKSGSRREGLLEPPESWSLNKKKSVTITTDSGANIKKAVRLNNRIMRQCLGNRLHTAMEHFVLRLQVYWWFLESLEVEWEADPLVIRSYTWPDSVSTCDTFLERGIVQASAGNNLMLTLYR